MSQRNYNFPTEKCPHCKLEVDKRRHIWEKHEKRCKRYHAYLDQGRKVPKELQIWYRGRRYKLDQKAVAKRPEFKRERGAPTNGSLLSPPVTGDAVTMRCLDLIELILKREIRDAEV